jgi:hypothetical protein
LEKKLIDETMGKEMSEQEVVAARKVIKRFRNAEEENTRQMEELRNKLALT